MPMHLAPGDVTKGTDTFYWVRTNLFKEGVFFSTFKTAPKPLSYPLTNAMTVLFLAADCEQKAKYTVCWRSLNT